MAYKSLKRRIRGAPLDELVRGITNNVTRPEAKRLARLHGHPWAVVRAAVAKHAKELEAAGGP
jgi:hypothetical protein